MFKVKELVINLVSNKEVRNINYGLTVNSNQNDELAIDINDLPTIDDILYKKRSICETEDYEIARNSITIKHFEFDNIIKACETNMKD